MDPFDDDWPYYYGLPQPLYIYASTFSLVQHSHQILERSMPSKCHHHSLSFSSPFCTSPKPHLSQSLWTPTHILALSLLLPSRFWHSVAKSASWADQHWLLAATGLVPWCCCFPWRNCLHSYLPFFLSTPESLLTIIYHSESRTRSNPAVYIDKYAYMC